MLASFLFSLLAGFLAPRVEEPLARLLARVESVEFLLDAREMGVLSFALMLLLAAMIAAALGADSSAFLALFGGVLGYFGTDLYAYVRDPAGAEGKDADDWDGEMAAPGKRRKQGDRARTDDEDTLRAVQAAVAGDEPPEKEMTR